MARDINSLTIEEQIAWVSEHPGDIVRIDEPDEEVQVAAVKVDPATILSMIEHRTMPALNAMTEAIIQDPGLIKEMKVGKAIEMAEFFAVGRDPMFIEKIEEPTPFVVLEALKGMTPEQVDNYTASHPDEFVRMYEHGFEMEVIFGDENTGTEFLPHLSEDVKEILAEKSPAIAAYIKNQDMGARDIELMSDPGSIIHMNNPQREYVIYAFSEMTPEQRSAYAKEHPMEVLRSSGGNSRQFNCRDESPLFCCFCCVAFGILYL